MRALPLDGVSRFEQGIERTWCSPRSSWAKRRDACVIGLGLCGLRWEEVSRIRVFDLVLMNCELSVRTAKGGVNRNVRIGQSLSSGMQGVWRTGPAVGPARSGSFAFYTREGKQLRYEAALRRVKAWTKIVFGQSFSFHCLRHTAAVRCYQATNDVLAVQRLLGHRTLRHTTVYLSSLETVRSGGLPNFVERVKADLRLFDPDHLGTRRVG